MNSFALLCMLAGCGALLLALSAHALSSRRDTTVVSSAGRVRHMELADTPPHGPREREFKLLGVTSLTRPYYDMISRPRVNRRGNRTSHRAAFEQSLWWRFHNQNDPWTSGPFELWVYHENSWERKHRRRPLTKSNLKWVDEFLDVMRVFEVDSYEPYTKYYAMPHTLSLSEHVMDGVVLVRKVAAMRHALSAQLKLESGASHIVWLDVDVTVRGKANTKGSKAYDKFKNYLSKFDVAYIAESQCHMDVTKLKSFEELPQNCKDFRLDTGVFVLKVSLKSLDFLDYVLDLYPGNVRAIDRSDQLKRPPMDAFQIAKLCLETKKCPKHVASNLGLNDIYVFALALNTYGLEWPSPLPSYSRGDSSLSQGWFALNCGKSLEQHKLGGYCSPCDLGVDESSTFVSHFPIETFFYHLKGGVGVMTNQHTKDRASNVTTHDPEVLLPNEYKRHFTSHIDPRMACGDKRSVFNKTWSLKQLD